VEELKKFPNFTYVNERFVLSYEEREDRMVEVTAGINDSNEREKYLAGALVLAAGTMSSARIALRSLQKYNVRIPILTNAYTYIPTINVNMIGVTPKDRRSSHGQLLGVYFPDGLHKSPVISYLFSYRSLLTFKLLKEAPLPQRECLKIMRNLINLFAIITIFHKDRPSPSKYCVLHKSEGNDPDRLEIYYKSSDDEIRNIKENEISIKRFYRICGCWPLKTIRRSPGSSIHNSGTLPMSKEKNELTTDAEGRLFGTRMVYLADGSVLSPLPSNMLTFTIMANANRVGTLLAQRLKK
jgi:choline dehydrogenase-like flavoprotein